MFKSLVQEPGLEWEFIDGSIVSAHQHGCGAGGSDDQAIGNSRGGNSTKIQLAVDSYGLPIEFEITAGQINDGTIALILIDKLPPTSAIVADKGYDSEAIRDQIQAKGAIAIIPKKVNSTKGNEDMDWCLYKYRHLVENAFACIKHFRAIATRYDKLKRNDESMVALAFRFLWLPM